MRKKKIEKPKDVGHFLVQKLLKPPKCPGVNGLTYQIIVQMENLYRQTE